MSMTKVLQMFPKYKERKRIQRSIRLQWVLRAKSLPLFSPRPLCNTVPVVTMYLDFLVQWIYSTVKKNGRSKFKNKWETFFNSANLPITHYPLYFHQLAVPHYNITQLSPCPVPLSAFFPFSKPSLLERFT